MNQQTLGQRIAMLRKKKQMTQLELAQRMGVSDKAVSKWERDVAAPDIHSIPKLAEIFAVSVDDLMQGKKQEPIKKQKNLEELMPIILYGIGAAMGIAVCVLSILNELQQQSAFTMLGIGLACSCIAMMNTQNRK